MGRTFGLDLGPNSIGWAIIDTDKNSIVGYGVRIFTTNQARIKQKSQIIRLFEYSVRVSTRIKYSFHTKPFLFGLKFISGLTFMLTIIDNKNWQFWLNISLTALLTILTIFHQDKKTD